MNEWFHDPRVRHAEALAFEAEQLERRGDFVSACAKYSEAGKGFAAVAIVVADSHPNTRSDLGIAALVSLARGGDFSGAVIFGRRMLAEPDVLTRAGRSELARLVDEYASKIHSAAPTMTEANRGSTVRNEVRRLFLDKRAA